MAAWIARRRPRARTLIGLVALGNVAWAVGCIALATGSFLLLTRWGVAWLAVQAVVVLVLADLQWVGLRHTRGPAHALRAKRLDGLGGARQDVRPSLRQGRDAGQQEALDGRGGRAAKSPKKPARDRQRNDVAPSAA